MIRFYWQVVLGDFYQESLSSWVTSLISHISYLRQESVRRQLREAPLGWVRVTLFSKIKMLVLVFGSHLDPRSQIQKEIFFRWVEVVSADTHFWIFWNFYKCQVPDFGLSQIWKVGTCKNLKIPKVGICQNHFHSSGKKISFLIWDLGSKWDPKTSTSIFFVEKSVTLTHPIVEPILGLLEYFWKL